MGEKNHPSYGIIRIARSSISGKGTALFGSSIMHNNVIRLSISRGSMERSDNEDRYFARELMKDKIVEVEMSYTQFAEAITSLNMGDGVPVTITNIGGKFVPECPYEDKQKIMRREVKEAVNGMVRKIGERTSEVETLLNEKRVLSKEDRSRIVSILQSAKQDLNSNLPYLNELFAEQMDKTVTEAKGEFETYLQNKMNSLALASLSDQMIKKEWEESRNMIPEKTEGGQEPEGTMDEPEDGMQMNM